MEILDLFKDWTPEMIASLDTRPYWARKSQEGRRRLLGGYLSFWEMRRNG